MAKKFIELQEVESLLKSVGAPGYAINALCLAPSYEAVHRSVYDQCAWERNLAIEQLRNDYGVGLGEKKSADVVEVVRCQNCVHAEPFERNCELNSSAYMHCTRGRGEEVRNVWHKYKKHYRDYSVVDRDGYCDEGERRDSNGNKENL